MSNCENRTYTVEDIAKTLKISSVVAAVGLQTFMAFFININRIIFVVRRLCRSVTARLTITLEKEYNILKLLYLWEAICAWQQPIR